MKGAARSLTIALSWMRMATPPSRRTRRARTWRSAAQSVEAYQLVLPSASIIQPLTRSYFANKGKALGLQVKVGDVIVVELTHENEKYMLGVVTKAHYTHSGEDIEVPYMGTIKARDDLVDVRKFEPMRGGSTVSSCANRPRSTSLCSRTTREDSGRRRSEEGGGASRTQRTRPERRLSWLRVCSGVQAQVCGSC